MPIGAHPIGNTGITSGITSPASPGEARGPRIGLELAKPVLSLLDHVCEVTGALRTQIITEALLQALPALLDRAEFVSRGVPVRRK
jgi:hypothetical protein